MNLEINQITTPAIKLQPINSGCFINNQKKKQRTMFQRQILQYMERSIIVKTKCHGQVQAEAFAP
jgi:hypothetical protein